MTDTTTPRTDAVDIHSASRELTGILHTELLDTGLVTHKQWNDAIAPALKNVNICIEQQQRIIADLLSKFELIVDQISTVDRYSFESALAERDAKMSRLRPLLIEVRALLYACHVQGDTMTKLDAVIAEMKEEGE